MKRGISPLIATVLIIGFTIVLALIIIFWGSSFIKGTTEKTGEQALKEIDMAGLDISVGKASVSGTLLSLGIVNNGEQNIDGLIVKVYGDTTTSGKIEESISGLGGGTYSITLIPMPENIVKVEVFPIMGEAVSKGGFSTRDIGIAACVGQDDCDDANSCTENLCNEATEECEYPNVEDQLPCDDGDECTLTDACIAGVCTGFENINDMDCMDDGECAFVPGSYCDEGVGKCVCGSAVVEPECVGNADCDDGDACTENVCSSGSCTFPAMEPDPPIGECKTFECVGGLFNIISVADGTACDGDAGECFDGECVALSAANEILYFSFNGLMDGNVPDLSGYGNNGVYSQDMLDPMIIADLYLQNPGYQGTGSFLYGDDYYSGEEYVDVPDSSSLDVSSDKITISVIIKPTSYLRHGRIVAKAWSSNADPYDVYVLKLGGSSSNSKAVFAVAGGPGNTGAVYSISDIPLNQWTHIVGTYDGNEVTIYINGGNKNSQAASINIAENSQSLRIGNNKLASNQYFNGLIDEVKIYDGALSATQVQELAASYGF